MIKALWAGNKFYSGAYPVIGPQSTAQGNFVVDLVKQGLKDTIDTLSVHLTGNIVQAGSTAGTFTLGAENPQGLMVLATLASAPQAAGLLPINAISSRAQVVDYALEQGYFQSTGEYDGAGGPITEVDGGQTFALDAWFHFKFKCENNKKSIDYAHPMYPWNSDLLTLVFGTRNQLVTGGNETWDMTGVTVELWADLDIDANPDQIHAFEIFEQQFNITAANPAFIINTLPQGCFYSSLALVAEDNGVMTDAIITNIDVEGGGRYWLTQGQNNAEFVRERYTKELFYDPTGATHSNDYQAVSGANGLTGLYAMPLRDGLWSRALDATSQPVVLKLAVNGPGSGHTFNIRLIGRKLVPGGIKKTVTGANGQQTVTGLAAA
jgi:hypothetical protein